MTVILAAHHAHLHVSSGAFLVGLMIAIAVFGRKFGGGGS